MEHVLREGQGLRQGYSQSLFTTAAAGMGLHPFPRPSANVPKGYTNPYGVLSASNRRAVWPGDVSDDVETADNPNG